MSDTTAVMNKRWLVSVGIAVAMLAAHTVAGASEPAPSEPSAFAILHDITPEAIAMLQRRAEAGEPRAQYMLGMADEFGRGITQDVAAAIAWYHKAAEGGYCAAQLVLGRKYYSGDDVAQDYAQAYRWFEPLARDKRLFAVEALASMYRYGWGVKADRVQARHWDDVGREVRKQYPGDPRSVLLDPEASCMPGNPPRSGPELLLRARIRLKGRAVDLAFSRDGKRLYAASGDEAIDVWDTARSVRLSKIVVPGEPLVIRANGERVLVRVPGKHVTSGRIAAGRFERRGSYGERVRSFCCHLDTGLAYTIFRIEEVSTPAGKFYRDSRTGQRLASVPPNVDRVAMGIDVSPDGKWITYGDGLTTATLHVWDVAGAREQRRLTPYYPLGVRAVAYSPDGKYVAIGGNELSDVGVRTLRNIRLWDIENGREVRSVLAADGFVHTVSQLVFSPDGTRLVAVGSNFKKEYAYIFDVASGRELARFAAGDYWPGIGRLVFSPDGKQLAAHQGGDIKLYSLEGL